MTTKNLLEMIMKKKSWTAAIHTDLYLAGITEDGEQYSAEVYYIVVEKEDGTRYAHFKAFKGCSVENLEDGYIAFNDVRKQAYKDAERLLQRIQQAGEIDLKYWNEIAPCYGSLAFQQINRF